MLVSDGDDSRSWILLDASCVMNLYATRQMPEILRAHSARFGIVVNVREESLYVRRGGSGTDAEEHDPVDLEPLIQSGVLVVFDLTPDEETTFIAFAARLDDGEAATCAVAIHRGMAVVMDDRKGRSVLAAAAPTVTAHRTLDLVRHWAESKSIPFAEIAQVLRAIRERARFFPGRTDPNKAWWDAILPL